MSGGAWLLLLLMLIVILTGAVYVARPGLFSRGWFYESRVPLPAPARNRVIGYALIVVGLLGLAAWGWLMLNAVGG